jgi:effector-binding domain-containing protein
MMVEASQPDGGSEGRMVEHEVKVGRREATLVMSKRLPVPISEMGGVFSAAFGEIYGHLGAHRIEPAGPPFVIYHGVPQGDTPVDLEICAPLGRAADPPMGWRLAELPAGMFATLMHVGPYDTIGTAYETLTSWIGTHDLVMAGPPREVYFSPPDTPPDRIRTIIEVPVAEAGVTATTS